MYAIYSQPMEVGAFHSLLELYDRMESGGRSECIGWHYSRRGRQNAASRQGVVADFGSVDLVVY